MRKIEDIAIIDAHHHLWDLSRFPYPWLTTARLPRRMGDYSSICETYLVQDFLADTKPCRVVASVHLQAETGANGVEESRWLGQLSRESPYPSAIIAKCDLTSRQVEAEIDAHLAAGPVRGVREPVHASSDARYAGHGTPDRLEALKTAPGLRVLAAKGLLLEVVAFFPQVPDLIRLLNAHPDLQVVINHACMPVHLDAAPPFADAEEGWRKAVAELARLPQVRMKISGLWMAGRRLTSADVRPIVRHAVDCFGVERCLFASNFPVDRLHTSYRDMMQTYLDCVDDLSDHEVAALFEGNAQKLYRIERH